MLSEMNLGIAVRYPGDRRIGDDAAVILHDDSEIDMPTDRSDMVHHLVDREA
jgi:hypothetical protein